MNPTCGVVWKPFNPGVPVFNMLINGKECDVLFDTGSTVNIMGKETLSEYLGIPDRFIQVKAGQVKAIQGITGQKISNVGNVQLSTELLGHKSVESFVVLPNTTFGADALIGYKTMRRWGLLLDCKNEEAVLNHQRTAVCLQLEDEMSFSNLADLTETTSSSRGCVPAERASENPAPRRVTRAVRRRKPRQGELLNHDHDVVLSVCENEHGQTAAVSGNDTSIIKNLEKHACIGTDADTDYMEVIEDPDLC